MTDLSQRPTSFGSMRVALVGSAAVIPGVPAFVAAVEGDAPAVDGAATSVTEGLRI